MTKAKLSKITIYPIKSLDGMDLNKATIIEGGCLLHDREYALFDASGNFVNGKSNPLVHTLRSKINFETGHAFFKANNETNWTDFHLTNEKNNLENYLSEHFGKRIFLIQNKAGRFLDIPDKAGATLLSTASLKEVSSWYPNLDIAETRKRFRATLEIEGVDAFWEDHLFSDPGKRIEFRIGNLKFFGESPRERCVVPTRNPDTAEVIHAFPKTFAKKRASTLPEFSKLEAQGHFYYLSVDCSIPATEIGKELKSGDELTIHGEI